MKTNLDIRNFTRRDPAPGVPFLDITNAILPSWDISLVFAGTKRAQNLNVVLRKKDYVPNVLSYETGKKSGEIIICPGIARIQAPTYGMSYKNFIGYLFIHGLLHLKGYPHGTTMDRYERTYVARFGFLNSTNNGTTNSNRD